MDTNIEKRILDTSQETAKEKRERIDRLRTADSPYEDSAYTLAKKEDEFREKLKEAKTSKEYIETLADIYSDESLSVLEREKEGHVDGLTSLKNHKALDIEMPGLLNLELREKKNCSVIMLDFDHFKEVNDTLGHRAGDQSLQQLAAVIKDTMRKSDIPYRYGGEEFIVFLHGTDLKGALDLAEKIRMTVENTVMKIKKENGRTIDLKKTVSAGVACTEQLEKWRRLLTNKDRHVSDKDMQKVLSDLINKSDAAMYESKKRGRNKVTAAK